MPQPNAIAALRRAFSRLALLVSVAALSACKTYIFLPVDVTYEKLSPPYVVSFVNETGSPFEVLPSSFGARTGHPNVRVAPGDSFKAILQLRRFTVGTGSSVAGAQVIDGPYFEHSPPDKAEIRFRQAQTRSMLLALQHPSWFDEYESASASPVELRVSVRAFGLTPLFPRGPPGGP